MIIKNKLGEKGHRTITRYLKSIQLPPDIKMVVDIDKAELDKPLVVPDMKINADLRDFIPELYNSIINQSDSYTEWLKFCQNIKLFLLAAGCLQCLKIMLK